MDVLLLGWCKCEYVKVSLVKCIIKLKNMLISSPALPTLGISPGGNLGDGNAKVNVTKV